MEVIVCALLLAFVIEFVTIYGRIVGQKKSATMQKKIGIPRIHHSYPGLAMILIDYVFLQNQWVFIIGFALVLSDLVHHLIFEPYIKKHRYDIGMQHHKEARTYIASLPAALALMTVGLFALITPFTPGSWLGLIGVGMLIGKDPVIAYARIREYVIDHTRVRRAR